MSALKIGIIGTGSIFHEHAAELMNLDDVEMTILCDSDMRTACTTADQYGFDRIDRIDRVTDDWRSVVESDDIDAVFILTPTSFHAEMAIAALEAGKHVLCEKPLARTLDEGRALVEAAEKALGICQIGFNGIFDQPTSEMLRLTREGAFGRIVRVWDRQTQYRATDSWVNSARRDKWRLSQESSGGRMQEYGSHKVNWMQAVGGPVSTVLGRSDSVAQSLCELGVDDSVFLHMDLVGGGIGQVDISLSPTTGPWRHVGIQGTEGSIDCFDDGPLLIRRKDEDVIREVALPPRSESRQAHFVRWAKGHKSGAISSPPTPEVTAQVAYHTLEICLAFLESAVDGTTISLG
jgi:predicted dehydrogenase